MQPGGANLRQAASQVMTAPRLRPLLLGDVPFFPQAGP
jgi:hypothetical protein